MRILVIGDSCLDVYVYGECNRMCPEAPVPVFEPFEEVSNGGMAQNVARNVRALGVKCDVVTHKEWKLITKSRYVDSKTNHMLVRIDANEADFDCFEQYLGDIDFNKYDAVIISDYEKGFVDEDDVVDICERHPLVFIDTKKLINPCWVDKVSFIKINQYEYERTKHLLSDVVREKMIITYGAGGCKYQDKEYKVPPVDVKDTSGAGDSFLSALVCKYVQSKDIDDAIRFANVVATVAVQRRGVSVIGIGDIRGWNEN